MNKLKCDVNISKQHKNIKVCGVNSGKKQLHKIFKTKNNVKIPVSTGFINTRRWQWIHFNPLLPTIEATSHLYNITIPVILNPSLINHGIS